MVLKRSKSHHILIYVIEKYANLKIEYQIVEGEVFQVKKYTLMKHDNLYKKMDYDILTNLFLLTFNPSL